MSTQYRGRRRPEPTPEQALAMFDDLVALGMRRVGRFELLSNGRRKGRIDFKQEKPLPEVGVYTFMDDYIKYVGSSRGTRRGNFAKRIRGYCCSSSKERHVYQQLLEALKSGRNVEVWALETPDEKYRGRLRMTTALGVEDGLLRTWTPPWNRTPRDGALTAHVSRREKVQAKRSEGPTLSLF